MTGADLRRRPPLLVALPLWLACAIMLGVGVRVGFQKFHRSAADEEMKLFAEHQVPSLLGREAIVDGKLARLDPSGTGQGPSPAEARRLLVDEAIPALLALRKQAEEVAAQTDRVRALRSEYIAAVDQWIDACRTSVRTIDDEAVSGAAGTARVRKRFREASDARQAFRAHLTEAARAEGFQLSTR